MTQLIDLSGQIFGNLEVLECVGADKYNRSKWRCKCSCGNEIITLSHYLRTGDTKSCGCLKKLAGVRNRITEGEASKRQLFRKYQDHAKARGYCFELTLDEFTAITQQACIVCGKLPQQIYKTRNTYGGYLYNGVDRLINTIGYIPGNCVPCCGDCNREKGTISPATVQRLYTIFKERGFIE